MHLKRFCAAALAAASLTALIPGAAALSDVSGWARGEVSKAEAAGLSPAAFGTLSAKGNITRAEFCAVALRLFESSTGRVAERTNAEPFTDTSDPQVTAASALGLVSGRGDGTFDPDASVTRQELCVMLGNVMRTIGEGRTVSAAALVQYKDADEVASWAAGDMADMVDRGVISGIVQSNGAVTLSPRSTATREQSLMMAVRLLETCGSTADGVQTDSVVSEPAAAPSGDPEAPSADPEDSDEKPAGSAVDPEGTPAAAESEGKNDSEAPETDQQPAQPIRPDAAYDLTEEEKTCLVFGSDEQGYDTSEQAEAAMTEITVPVWRLQEDGSKTAGEMTLTVNAALAELYQAVFEEIFAGDEKFPIKNGGGYAWRSNERSEHRWGTAIDLNWEENMECNIDSEGNVTQITSGSCWEPGENPYSIPADGDVVRAFKKYGFSWGGDAWSKKRDYMHFSYF
ncbi:MAG: S-layer homology domain-containing protein, partial [Butyricicoccus sp.]